MTRYHLAQINIGRFRAPKDDPANADFVGALDRVNALAEASPGFVWRLIGAGNDAMDLEVGDDPHMAANMSVWEDMEALAAFAYRNMGHRSIMRRRHEWFEPMEVYMALWWIPEGETPTLAEGLRRLAILEANGPTAEAFLFKTPFPPPGGAFAKPILESCD